VNAIAESEDASYEIISEKCIGCALCVSACPTEAITMLRKPEEEVVAPPVDEAEWFQERGSNREVDFSQYE
jgi:Fe-S-cluster-containing hydrogenase component 2